MQFLDSTRAFVYTPIYRRCDGEGATDDGAYACQETGKGLGAFFPVDYFNGGDVVAEEDAWYAAPVMKGLAAGFQKH